MSRLIIGLTGTNGAGKTAAADHLQSQGFAFVSLSDEIRHELRAQGHDLTRDNLMDAGNRLRREHGRAVLAERALARMAAERDYVVDSIRNPAEVDALRTEPGFHLIHIDAPIDVRYERVCRRGDERVPTSFADFEAQEQREMESDDPGKQRLAATWKMAERVIINGTGLDELAAALEEMLESLR